MTLEQLSWFVDDIVMRALQGVKGVGRVERIGGVDREIRIALDPDRLLAFGITAGDVNRQLRATNVDLPAAAARSAAGSRPSARWPASRRVEDLAATMIALPGGRKVRLDQISARSTDDASRAAHVRAPQRRAGRRLRHLARQGRRATVGRRRRRRQARRAAASSTRTSQLKHDRRRRRLHARHLHFDHEDADRGRGARHARRASSSCATGARR